MRQDAAGARVVHRLRRLLQSVRYGRLKRILQLALHVRVLLSRRLIQASAARDRRIDTLFRCALLGRALALVVAAEHAGALLLLQMQVLPLIVLEFF